jgi:hypothetical protein
VLREHVPAHRAHKLRVRHVFSPHSRSLGPPAYADPSYLFHDPAILTPTWLPREPLDDGVGGATATPVRNAEVCPP